MSLRAEVFKLLDNTRLLCRQCPGAEKLAASLEEMRARLETPLRVAVVGSIKAGKSTFMNALMGTDLLCTGSLETTYSVCWFRYGEQPGLTVRFRDGSTREAPIADLEKWSARASEKANAQLREVKYLVIHYPSEVLRSMEFIDTPGLDSIYGTDAQNTLDFLSLRGSEDTVYEAGAADAILYAFNRTASGYDKNILQEFHRGRMGTVSPINSVGIFTKADITGGWDILGDATPIEAARAVTSNLMKDAEVKQLLFTILPVCAKVCEGFAQLKEPDWAVLRRIAEIGEEERKDLLYDAEAFCNGAESAAPGSVADRTRLMDLLGQWGILEIAGLLREGAAPEEMAGRLQAANGVRAVRELLLRHFGNRAFLIKSQYIFNHLRGTVRQIRKEKEAGAQLQGLCRELLDGIDNLMVSIQTLKELKVLQMYYSGQLQFPTEEERQDFLRITGEYGRSPEARLGVQGALTVAELAGMAREKAVLWQERTSGWMRSNDYIDAASTIARSYEQMCFHLSALSEE